MIVQYNIKNEKGVLRKLSFEKLTKGTLGTKKLLKINILDQQESLVQSADRTKAMQVWSWGNTYLPNPEKWLSQHYLKINRGFHARKNPKQQYLSESSHAQWCFIHQWVDLLKKKNLGQKSFYQTLLNEVLKFCKKWYLLMLKLIKTTRSKRSGGCYTYKT